MIGLAHRGFRLNDYRQHLANFLGSAGYFTALTGVQHEAPQAEVTRLGYREILLLPSDPARDVTPAAVSFLSRPHSEPFFLSIGYSETHREYPAPGPEDDPRYLLPPAPLPDLPQVRADLAGFQASARRLDEGVGPVLQALEANGLAENTLVISTTDHGIAFPAMKCNLTDHGLGVYLILRGPGGFQGGRVIDEMVSHLDIYPTLCELLDLPTPVWLQRFAIPSGGQGRSLLPLLEENPVALHEELFGEVTYHAAYEPQRSVRSHRWKYIRRFGERTRPVLPNCDDSPSKSAWLELGWAARPVDPEQLYDLAFDPNERHNLVGQAENAAALADLRAKLESWMQATADPLLDGPVVPAPRPHWLNDPDGLSPNEAPILLG